jgi:2-oxoglutarate ferredoxin oxidoreductase subunit delta
MTITTGTIAGLPSSASSSPNPAALGETPKARKGPRGEVTIYAKWCKGCHICVAFCPPKVLVMGPGDDHPTVAHPDQCTACHFCDTHCPDLAIVVRKLD